MGADDAIQELVDLEYAWLEATRTRDMEFLERLLGEEFTLTTGRPGVEVRSRAEWLDVTRDSYAIDSFEFADVDARVYGDAALVRSHYRQRGRMGGEDRTTAYLMSDVLVRRDGRWQAVARHISPLEQDPPDRGLRG
ncbi:MAG TPA: nuclear transport factor 2 family protein [Thermoleophilaceae bacterium]